MKKILILGIALILSLSFADICRGQVLVKKGDTLFQIAKKNKMTLNEIMCLNPQISNPNMIRAGDYLKTDENPQDLSFAYLQWDEVNQY